MRSPFRLRGLAVALLVVMLAACVGAFAAWRAVRSKVAPTAPTWQPPTPAAAAIAPTAKEEGTTPVAGQTIALPTSTPVLRSTSVPIDDVVPSPSPTSARESPRPDSEVVPADGYRFLPAGPVRHTAGGCPGLYVMGVVQDSRGNALANVRLRNTDQWGNEAFTTSKSAAGELGRYDFPLFPPNGLAVTYSIEVVDAAGNPIGPAVSVPHHHDGPSRDASCHWVDWSQVE